MNKYHSALSFFFSNSTSLKARHIPHKGTKRSVEECDWKAGGPGHWCNGRLGDYTPQIALCY